MLMLEADMTLVHAFLSSRLNHCTSLLTGVCDRVQRKLQSVQNAAACFITNARKSCHITTVFRDLHGRIVRQKFTFKFAVLLYKCLHGLVPVYLIN